MPQFAEFLRESYFCLTRPSQKVQIGNHSGKPIHTLLSRPIISTYRSANQTTLHVAISQKSSLKRCSFLHFCPGISGDKDVIWTWTWLRGFILIFFQSFAETDVKEMKKKMEFWSIMFMVLGLVIALAFFIAVSFVISWPWFILSYDF